MDKFTNKLEQILNLFPGTDEEKTLVKADLLAAIYVELTNKMVEKLKAMNLNSEEEINKASNIVLESFVQKLESKIPSDKLTQIKALI